MRTGVYKPKLQAARREWNTFLSHTNIRMKVNVESTDMIDYHLTQLITVSGHTGGLWGVEPLQWNTINALEGALHF